MKKTLALASFLAVAVCAPAAYAVPEFPADIQSDMSLPPIKAPQPPLAKNIPCSICHQEGNVGIGSARTPFALNLRARGLNSDDESTLKTALVAMFNDHVDSDGDGVTDIEEIIEDTDPNSTADDPLDGRSEVAHGCNADKETKAQVAPKSAGGVFALGAIAGFVALARRRRRR